MDGDGCRVSLLNPWGEYVATVGWQRAMILVVLNKVEVLSEYDKWVRSAREEWRVPKELRLLRPVNEAITTYVKFTRNNLFARDKFTCQYCGNRFSRDSLTFDHVIPKSRGGATAWGNIVACCKACNRKKDNRTPYQAQMQLRSVPVQPRRMLRKLVEGW